MGIVYKKVNYWGFDYNIEELSGQATLYIYSNKYDRKNPLYKYIDEEHGVAGGGYYSRAKAEKSFKEKIQELQK